MLRRSLKNVYKIIIARSVNSSARLQSKNNSNENDDDKEISSSVATRFQVFKNDSVGVIYDVEEERAIRQLKEEAGMIDEDEENKEEETLSSLYEGINLERGKTGVYDIEDLVELLKKENAIDLCVIKVPKEYSYVDYLCIVTGSSFRHMGGMADFVRKVYKLKRNPEDLIPAIEGRKLSKDWMAMDLGNIALHIFSKEARETYSLETLWTLGVEYEKRTSKPDTTQEIYDQYVKGSQIDENDKKEEKV